MIIHMLRIAILTPLTLILAWALFLLYFAEVMIPDAPADEPFEAQALVVLTGGALRIEHGLELLKRNQDAEMLISGVGQGVKLSEIDGAAEFAGRITLGHEAGSTEENAIETANWVLGRNYKTIRLITACYHMPRSLLELERRLDGLQIIPDPVFPENVKMNEWWKHPGSRKLIVSEYHKYLFAFFRPLLQRMVL